MKFIVFLRSGRHSDEVLIDTARELAKLPGVNGFLINMIYAALELEHGVIGAANDSELPYNASMEIRTDRRNIVETIMQRLPDHYMAHAYRVTELTELAPPDFTGTRRPGLKTVAPWYIKPGVIPADARRHWDEHVELALRVHTGMSGYERNWVEQCLDEQDPAFQGIAAVWFMTEAEADEGLYDKPEDAQLIAADAADFIGESLVMRAIEYRFL